MLIEATPSALHAAEPAPRPGASDLDRAVQELGDAARAFARTPPAEKAALLRSLVPRLLEAAPRMVALACHAKGIDPASPTAAEEWLAGPYPILANARLLAESLDDIARRGRPSIARRAIRTARLSSGEERAEVRVVPVAGLDGLLQRGFRVDVRLAPGVPAREVPQHQAFFYGAADPDGAVALVLGAGNVASIPAMDAFYKLFVEGRVVLLKMSPVNAYLGPVLEHALAPLVERGALRIVYGGAEEGAYLCAHPGVAEVHVTGSAETHDRIVWGPPGPERDRRKAAGTPLLAKRVTSELGNISPVIVVPYLYAHDELWFQARSVAAQVGNNASFNCNAAKMLVVSRRWPQRDLFLDLVRRALAQAPCRKAYYPGAAERHGALAGGRPGAAFIGTPAPGELPWTLIRGLDASDAAEPLFATEPFCGILSEVVLDAEGPCELLDEASRFCNDRLWGTLSACIVAPALHTDDPELGAAVERAVDGLRYGTVALNHWPALVYGFVVPPWGGHPSATLADVRSGIGFVHNTLMLERVEKVVLRGPLRAVPRPPYFLDHRRARDLGEVLTSFAASPSMGKAARLAGLAIQG